MPRRHPLRLQTGYSLLELSIVLSIMALVIMSFIAFQLEQAQTEKARQVAQTYTRLNNAVGSYLTNFYDKLIALKPECGHIDWGTVRASGVTPVNYSGCTVNLSLNSGPSRAIQNGLQPTLKELASLGLLESGADFIDGLPLPTYIDAIMVNSDWANWLYRIKDLTGKGQYEVTRLPNQFMVLIQFICVVPNAVGGVGSAAFTKTGGCKSNTFDLRSLVFNSQPYSFFGRYKTTVLDRALQIAGSDAYVSDNIERTNQTTGMLRSVAGSAEPVLVNPSRHHSWGNRGVLNIFAMRNGYGSSGWDRYVRRDGSTPMTSNWNYGGQNVSNIQNLDINQNAGIGGNLNVTQNVGIGGGLDVTQSANVGGNINAMGTRDAQGNVTGGGINALSGAFGTPPSSDTVWGWNWNNLSYALKATSALIGDLLANTLEVLGAANFKGNLTTSSNSQTTLNGPVSLNGNTTVAGNMTFAADKTATFNGTTDLKGQTNIDQFRLTKEAAIFESCDPTKETLRKQVAGNDAYNAGLRLLVCEAYGTSGRWTRPQELSVVNNYTVVNTAPKNNLQGHFFTINYRVHGCDWAGRNCLSGGNVPAHPDEWSAELVTTSTDGTGGSVHVNTAGNGYWIDLKHQPGGEADTHIKWTSKKASPTTFPANLVKIANATILDKTCSTGNPEDPSQWANGWLYWSPGSYNGIYNTVPNIMYMCDLVNKSPGFSWTP